MKPKCWLIAVAMILFIIIGGRLVINHRTHQFQVLSQTIAQQINQQPVNPSSLEYHIYKPPFNLSLDNPPNQFEILSKAPELQIGYQRSKLFRFWTFFCILPFIPIPILLLLGGLAAVWQERFWEIIRYSLGEAIHFVLVLSIWGWFTWYGLWLAFETVEYRAFHESFTVMHQSLGMTRSQTILSTAIQSFNVFIDRSRDGIRFNLEVVSYPKIEQQSSSSLLGLGSKQAVNHTSRRIKLYRDSSVDRVVWLGIVLADFYNTNFQVSES